MSSIYFPGVSITPFSVTSGGQTTIYTGASTVTYQLRDATGTPAGVTLTGVQVSATEIQPDGWSTGDPLVIIGTGQGEAANVSASAVLTTTSQYITGNGLPAVRPANEAAEAVYEALDLNVFFRWDTNDLVWRSAGLISDSVVLANLPANVWTDFPTFPLITEISDWEFYSDAGNQLTFFETQRRTADNHPQVRSLNAYTNVTIEASGYSVVTV